MKFNWDKFWTGMFWVALGIIIYVVFFGEKVYALPPLKWNMDGQWVMPPQGTMVQPLLPGSGAPNYSQPSLILRGNQWHQTIPGTSVPDPSRPGLILRGNRWHQTIPGTPFVDPSKPSYRVQPPQDGLFDYNDMYR